MPQIQRALKFMFVIALIGQGLALQPPAHSAAWSAEDHVYYLPFLALDIPPIPPSTVRVSVASDGTEANSGSGGPAVSEGGRYVAFVSWASNLVAGDTNGMLDVFVHDVQTGETTRVSVSSEGAEANHPAPWYAHVSDPSISADGRFVAFSSTAYNLVPGDTQDCLAYTGSYVNCEDVFVHDRLTGETTRVSVASDGTQGNGPSTTPYISADGRIVVFASTASNLVANDRNDSCGLPWEIPSQCSDVFVHDRSMGATTRVSVSTDGEEGNGDSFSPAISADGRVVAFASRASNLVPGDTNADFAADIFVHDRATGETTRVSVASDGTQAEYESAGWPEALVPSVSGDGRFVAFYSQAINLAVEDVNDEYDVFVHDRLTGETTLISRASDGAPVYDRSLLPVISADGRYVAFWTFARLIPADVNCCADMLVHDRLTGETTVASVASDGTQGDDFAEWRPAISPDGRFVAFSSRAGNLVPGDTNRGPDVFLRDRGRN